MRRWPVVVALALLAITAQPAAAGNVTLVSEHTTFGTGGGEPAPSQLSGMSVSGSGDSASVVYDSGSSSAGTNVESTASTRDTANEAGVVINPNKHIEELTVGTDFDSGATQINVRSTSGALLGSGSISAFSSTSAATITGLNLEPGTDYRVTAGDAGAVYQLADSNDNLPITSRTFDIVGGYEEGAGQDSSSVNNIDVISAESPASGEYVSATHDAADVTEGYVNITGLSNADVTSTWQYYDGASWVDASTTTYSSTGNKSVTLSGNSDQWRVRVTPQRNSVDASATVAAEGVLADSATPTLSGPDPTGNISSYDGDISINVSDADFGRPQGDSVTVAVNDSDGDQIGQTTVSSNQTVSFQYVVKAGANNLTWTATDAYSNSDTATQDFDGPTFLSVRNESAPSNIINTTSNVTATFFAEGSETVVKKSSATGRFDFSGLPAAKRYVVSVDAAGYRPRQVVIGSLFEQQSVYLLPENATAATVEFQLNDQTGRFASESTTLFVEIPLTRNNSTEYRTAFADQFGATDSLRVDLRDETRYRIKVRNDQGETRVLESYTTSGDAIAPLTIGQVQVSGEIGDRGVAFEATVVETDTGRALRVVYRDPEQLTDNVEIGVEYNGSAYVPNTTGTAGYGRYITTIPIDNSTPDNATFNVTYAALRDGATIHGQTQAGAVGELDFGVASQPLSLLGWMLTLGLTSMVIIRTPRLAPATGTATASMLTIAGVLAIPAPALGISGAISVLAVAGRGGGQ